MSKPTHHPAGQYVLRYTHPGPPPPYTRIAQLTIAASPYQTLRFTVGAPVDLTAREAAAYCAVPLPPGLVLVCAERDASEE